MVYGSSMLVSPNEKIMYFKLCIYILTYVQYRYFKVNSL